MKATLFRTPIDVTAEDLILPKEVASVLPKQKGKKVNVSTVYRWMQNGLRGVRLEFICIGGTRFTSKQALNRFFARVTHEIANIDDTKANTQPSASKQAIEELKAAGI